MVHRIEANILFGKYRIISILGTGSSSTVYLAEHLKLKTYRALKCIPKNTVSVSALFTENSFPLEADLLKHLFHPGIPLIYDIDEDDNFIYMVEEYIQGESLDTFVSHQKNISQEMIIQFGIQICGIIDYLHHLSPYPILYQDLKPEHIILCGNQIKLVDFGIASLFTDFGNQFQFYGTDHYTAPEIQAGFPASPACDIYGIGKILDFLVKSACPDCSPELIQVIKKASAVSVTKRYETAADLKHALLRIKRTEHRQISHLIQTIAVTGVKAGAGTTHLCISLVSTLNQIGLSAVYTADNSMDTLPNIDRIHTLKEKQGVFVRGFFQGVPDYGKGVEDPVPQNYIRVRDCAPISEAIPWEQTDFDLLLVILSGSDWDIAQSLSLADRINSPDKVRFICNFGNRYAAKRLARMLQKQVLCFPCISNPYIGTPELKRLVRILIKKKGGTGKFFTLIKREQKPT